MTTNPHKSCVCTVNFDYECTFAQGAMCQLGCLLTNRAGATQSFGLLPSTSGQRLTHDTTDARFCQLLDHKSLCFKNKGLYLSHTTHRTLTSTCIYDLIDSPLICLALSIHSVYSTRYYEIHNL